MRLLVVSLTALALAGCIRPEPLAIPYSPSGIARLTNLEAVAVYRLADKRNEEPTRIGGMYGMFRETVARIYGEEPAATTATRALAGALTARGFEIVALMSDVYLPRISEPPTRVAITGELRRLWSERHWSYEAECALLVQVYEVRSGQKLWEKEYRARRTEGMPVLPTFPSTQVEAVRRLLIEQLSRVVRDAATDPELLSHAGRRW
jgi:hypothetical protein